MASSSTYSAEAPDVGQSHTTLNEPSMEDILASIRRIIAEDQSNNLGRSGLTGLARRASQGAPAPSPIAPPAPELHAAEPALEPKAEVETPIAVQEYVVEALAEIETVAAPFQIEDSGEQQIAPDFRASLDGADLALEPNADAPALPAHEPVAVVHDGDESVYELSDSERVPSVRDQEPLISSAAGASITSSFQTLADTMLMQDPELIERIMRETLRPMLKTWLDDHLPSLVERLVRAEIERVARGGRSRE